MDYADSHTPHHQAPHNSLWPRSVQFDDSFVVVGGGAPSLVGEGVL